MQSDDIKAHLHAVVLKYKKKRRISIFRQWNNNNKHKNKFVYMLLETIAIISINFSDKSLKNELKRQ